MKTLAKLLLILNPIPAAMLAGYLQSKISEDPGNMGTGVVLAGVVLLGIPFIAVTGLIFSFIKRNDIDADRSSIFAYFVPALVTWLFAASAVFS